MSEQLELSLRARRICCRSIRLQSYLCSVLHRRNYSARHSAKLQSQLAYDPTTWTSKSDSSSEDRSRTVYRSRSRLSGFWLLVARPRYGLIQDDHLSLSDLSDLNLFKILTCWCNALTLLFRIRPCSRTVENRVWNIINKRFYAFIFTVHSYFLIICSRTSRCFWEAEKREKYVFHFLWQMKSV